MKKKGSKNKGRVKNILNGALILIAVYLPNIGDFDFKKPDIVESQKGTTISIIIGSQ
ncbi:hypothetical protein ABLB90_00830 [Photorhabdus bodei]|uniref:Uncharacterized protein n=1 Tax=Photorhabdus aegyptia TaxID=2805098 RepID=A0A022PRM9_9GAMM|nr:hypothetical protein [Photorhabdus aegyptia]EYU16985.1 hypothetical protein BA1DRAFT_00505 [Photorhabdus aegyptia]